MAVKFTYHGGMTMLIERDDGYKIICDPFISNNPAAVAKPEDFYDVDLVIVTHAAFDHFGDTAEIMKNSNAVLIAGGDVIRMVEAVTGSLDPSRKRLTIYGDELRYGETTVRTVMAWHCSNSKQNGVTTSSEPFGYIVNVEKNVTYYHAGDTSLFTDMKLIRELYKPNVMAVGISRISEEYACELNPKEAAFATSWIGPDVVVPTHYAPGSPALDEYLKCMDVLSPNTCIKTAIGQSFTYKPYVVE